MLALCANAAPRGPGQEGQVAAAAGPGGHRQPRRRWRHLLAAVMADSARSGGGSLRRHRRARGLPAHGCKEATRSADRESCSTAQVTVKPVASRRTRARDRQGAPTAASTSATAWCATAMPGARATSTTAAPTSPRSAWRRRSSAACMPTGGAIQPRHVPRAQRTLRGRAGEAGAVAASRIHLRRWPRAARPVTVTTPSGTATPLRRPPVLLADDLLRRGSRGSSRTAPA